MEIIKIDRYRDGGTTVFYTNNGEYYLDCRIGSLTKDKWFDHYPDNNSKSLVIFDEYEFYYALKNYKNKTKFNIISYKYTLDILLEKYKYVVRKHKINKLLNS